MAIKFDRIQLGMTLWVVMRRRMGNTKRSETVCDPRHVEEVDSVARRIRVSWNGRSEWVPESRCTKWRKSPLASTAARGTS
jgi:hypothetical protein